MRIEAAISRIHPEINPKSSVVAPNVLFVNFSGPDRGPVQNNKIVGISSFAVEPMLEILPKEKKASNIIKFPETDLITKAEPAGTSPIEEVKKKEAYNPSRRAKELITENGKLVLRRVKRASRCNGSHDAETDPCGSPRCRTKNKAKVENRQTAGKEKTTSMKSPRHLRTKIVFGKGR